METLALDGGFTDAVHDAQSAFRAIMDGLANPGQVQTLTLPAMAPDGLALGLAAVALTLCDHDTPLFLSPSLAGNAGIVAWLRFHTGAPLTGDPAAAEFALIASSAELPALADFAQGTDEYPDRSTIIALALDDFDGGPLLALRGPGIEDHAHLAASGLPSDFLSQWADNRQRFPRGIDLLLLSGERLLGLPRTTRISMEAH